MSNNVFGNFCCRLFSEFFKFVNYKYNVHIIILLTYNQTLKYICLLKCKILIYRNKLLYSDYLLVSNVRYYYTTSHYSNKLKHVKL